MQLFDQVWNRKEALGVSPLPIASLRVFTLQRQDYLGVHRIFFMFSCNIVLPRVLKSSTLHGLFQAQHAYLCLVR